MKKLWQKMGTKGYAIIRQKNLTFWLSDANAFAIPHCFFNNPEGHQAFISFLSKNFHLKEIVIIIDLAEEEIQLSLIPYIRWGQASMIKQHLKHTFPDAYRTAWHKAGRDPSGRKDLRLQISTLAHSQNIAPWLEAVCQAQIAITQMSSLVWLITKVKPLLSEINKNQLLIIEHPANQLRHVVIFQGVPTFTRLSHIAISPDNIKEAQIAKEISRTVIYLEQQQSHLYQKDTLEINLVLISKNNMTELHARLADCNVDHYQVQFWPQILKEKFYDENATDNFLLKQIKPKKIGDYRNYTDCLSDKAYSLHRNLLGATAITIIFTCLLGSYLIHKKTQLQQEQQQINKALSKQQNLLMAEQDIAPNYTNQQLAVIEQTLILQNTSQVNFENTIDLLTHFSFIFNYYPMFKLKNITIQNDPFEAKLNLISLNGTLEASHYDWVKLIRLWEQLINDLQQNSCEIATIEIKEHPIRFDILQSIATSKNSLTSRTFAISVKFNSVKPI